MPRGRSRFRSERRTGGRPGIGKPWGISPRSATPRPERSSTGADAIPPTTARRATGRFGSIRLPRISRMRAAAPVAREAGFVSRRWVKKWPIRSQKSP